MRMNESFLDYIFDEDSEFIGFETSKPISVLSQQILLKNYFFVAFVFFRWGYCMGIT